MTGYLRGEAAQTFVDVVHEVRLHFPLPLRPGLTTIAPLLAILLTNQSGFGPLQPFATSAKEIPKRFVQNLWSLGFITKTATNLSSLQQMERPALQRRIRGRVERRVPRPPRRSQGLEGVLNQ